MTKRDFIDMIDDGGDIEFVYAGQKYTILCWYKDGPLIGPQNANNDKVFRNGADMVDHYLIDGIPLASILNDIEITFSN